MSLAWSPGFNGVTDPDAQTYIAAVEAADGQAIEGDVALAINDFVVGCKLDGIWDAIKASCILAGARTLSGALVPLKGTAPTSHYFVSSDYNRETGLKGNASNKWLNSNRAGDADPVNSAHVSVFASEASSAGYYKQYIAAGDTNPVGPYKGLAYDTTGANRGTYGTCNSNNALGSTGTQIANFLGISRPSSTSVDFRRSSTTVTISDTSTSAPTYTHGVFALNRSSGVSNYSDARLAFYSIGEAIDLEKLDTRTTQLMNGISYGVSPDADAQTYIQAVETADNRKLEFHVAAAINAFVVGCKADGIWNAINSSCILAGARTLAGALVPLKGPTVNNGVNGTLQFAEADYDRKTGLNCGGTNVGAILRPDNYYSNSDPQDDHHASFYVTDVGSIANNKFMFYSKDGSDENSFGWTYSQFFARSRSTTTFQVNVTGISGSMLLGISRSSSSSFDARYDGITATASSTSVTPGSGVYSVCGLGTGTASFDGRSSFFSIGESLDLALLDARVSTLMTDIGAAIP